VSVGCDQLVRGLAPHRFDIYSIIGGNDHEPSWELPDNVIAAPDPALGWRPIVAPVEGILAELTPFLTTGQLHGRSQRRARLPRGAPAPVRALARTPLTGALQSKESLEILLGAMQLAGPTNRRLAGTAASATYPTPGLHWSSSNTSSGALRAAPKVDICHATANGLSVLPALGAYCPEPRPLC